MEIRGNERADSLSSKATIVDRMTMDLADVLNAIMDTGQIKFSGCKLDSASLATLLELAVHTGGGNL